MKLLQRPGVRFGAAIVAIIAVAGIAAGEHLAWWVVAICELAIVAAAFATEAWMATRPLPPAVDAEPLAKVPQEAAPHVRVLVPDVPEPRAPATQVFSAAGPWKVDELERLLGTPGDASEERLYLLHYLRDYAAPDGTLPPEFDDLVRESFGQLPAAPA